MVLEKTQKSIGKWQLLFPRRVQLCILEIMEFTLTEKQHVRSVYWDLVRLDGDGISKRIRDVKRTEQIGII